MKLENNIFNLSINIIVKNVIIILQPPIPPTSKGLRHDHPFSRPCTVPDRNMLLHLLPQWVSPCQSSSTLVRDRSKEAFCKEVCLRDVRIHQFDSHADRYNSPVLVPVTPIRIALTLEPAVGGVLQSVENTTEPLLQSYFDTFFPFTPCLLL